MGGRRRAASLAASPTMVGAITTLIVIVAVFLAYNANQGLPFVPTYRVSAEMCNAARLAPNNEVRIGGNRVGVVESIETVELEEATGCQATTGDSASTAAKVNLKLDESAKPLPDDSIVRVRYRSSFGLKYLEVERGTGQGMAEGATLPVSQSEEQVEFDDIANTFDTPTRESSRIVLEGFGNAFAARGVSLNQAIESLAPLFGNLQPVARALADPSTRLANLFPELGDAARLVAPVAAEQAEFFTFAGIAFAAITADPDALRDTISEGPPTLRTGIRSLPVQRPFLRDFAAFSRLLRPGVRDLRISLPILNDAIARGKAVLPRTVRMNQDLQGVMVELEELVDSPSTLISLQRLGTLFDETTSAASHIVPAQTVCNYWNYWFQFLPEHFSGEHQFGLAERLIGPGVPGTTTPDHFPRNPMNTTSGAQADGTYSPFNPFAQEKGGNAGPPPFLAGADEVTGGAFDPLFPDSNPATAPGLNPSPFNPSFDDPIEQDDEDDVAQPLLHGSPYGPTGQGGNDCQSGQFGYPLGEALSINQDDSNPTFGPYNIAESVPGGIPFGVTDLFLRQNGVREFATP